MANISAFKSVSLTLATIGTGTGIVVGASSTHSTDKEGLNLKTENLGSFLPGGGNNSPAENHYLAENLGNGNFGIQFQAQDLVGGEFHKTENRKEDDLIKDISLKKAKREAESIYKILEDYSFKLFSPDCTTGTGWILDYQIPEKKGDYPTVWYIVTNAHVIQSYRFSENPYQQLLPWEDTKGTLEKRARSQNFLDQLKNYSLDKYVGPKKCEAMDRYGYLDIGMSKGDEGVAWGSDYGMVGRKRIKEPKLFFSAFNFLNPESGAEENHYADFVVLEIEFTSQMEAKRVTNNFAYKYDVDSTEAINIFAGGLEERYTKKQLNELQDNFYILAYPGTAKSKWDYTINFDEKSGLASKLSGSIKPETAEYYRGFVDAKTAKSYRWRNLQWDRKIYRELGHWYEMDHNPLDRGSSGGLFVDGNRNAISVNAAGSYTSFSVPLRSKKISFKQWGWGDKVITPAYDLILGGAKGQNNSYKDQVVKHLISKNKKTWLSERRWRHVEDSSPWF